MTENEAVERIRAAQQAGTLEVVIGAGASIGAGLPTWDELNVRLLRSFLAEQYKDLEFQASDLTDVAAVFVQHFGREAVVDLVRQVSGEPEYRRMFHRALYGSDGKDVSILHYELAALLRGRHSLRGLHTFNFDDLLERAIHQLIGLNPQVLLGGKPRGTRRRFVRHLHGYLPELDVPSKLLILSERDYHVARTDSGQEFLERLLVREPEKTILLIGLSLTDPRLRGVLLQRVGKRVGTDIPEIIALASGSTTKGEALIQRLAGTFVARREVGYWDEWPVRLVRIPQHDGVPLVLRRVRLGDDARAWVKQGYRFLRRAAEDIDGIYTRQSSLVAIARPLLDFIRRRYAAPSDEEVELGAFVPTSEGHLRLGFRCSTFAGAPLLDEAHARRRTLFISLRRAQGAAGHALVQGYPMEVRSPSAIIDRYFTGMMRSEWNRDRVFSSMLCVPIYDSADWVPTGLVYLTSNARKPFWSTLERASELDRLFAELRNIYVGALAVRSAVIH